MSLYSEDKGCTFREKPDDAFLEAIRSGRLSEDKEAPNFAGNYTYMYTDPQGKDQFKHSWHRDYLP